MARTITAIYDEIVTEKSELSELSALQPSIDDSQTLLSDLTTTSKVAVWRLWAFVTAVTIWTHEKLWDAFKAEVDAIVAAAIPGTAKWYREMSLLYQHGDSLVYSNYKYNYDPVDTSKQIIKRASATEQGGNALIKVAKLVDGAPVPLSDPEKAAFKAYIDLIKFAGTFCPIVSDEADLVNITLTVYYDPTLLNASGELLSDTSISPVEVAINTYIEVLPWDGILLRSAVSDAVQAATGVSDVIIDNIEAKAAGASTYDAVSRSYLTVSGYLRINTFTINYINV